MKIESTEIAAVKIIHQFHHEDERGKFVKPFHKNDFEKNDIFFEMKECFYSTSKKNVIRGMHFHNPPYQHAKIVFCTQGEILDVALDLRKSEGTYGKFVEVSLSAEKHNALYIPEGFAHGFISLSEESTVVYFVNGMYDAKSDAGIHYNSFGKIWESDQPILSERDNSFTSFNNFNSPF